MRHGIGRTGRYVLELHDAGTCRRYLTAIEFAQEGSWETQVGQRQYAQYQQRGEIVPQQSPLYGVLDPIGNSIAAVADREYYAPFHFILLNERVPNAMSMPDGNVYVTTAMLSFLKNRDQLAGVLCHEINHDIHHDMYRAYQISPNAPPPADFTRAAESNADRGGAYTCAQAGFNPWGMVWNFREHEGMAATQTISAGGDHPSDAQRLADLVTLLQGDPGTFGKFRDDVAASTALAVPAQMSQQAPYGQPGYPGHVSAERRRSATRLSAVSAAAAAISSERCAVPAAPAAAVLSRVLALSR